MLSSLHSLGWDTNKSRAADPSPVVEFGDDAVAYRLPGVSAEEWTSVPMAYPMAAELGAFLATLYTDGIGERDAECFRLPWHAAYEVLANRALEGCRDRLLLPSITSIRPTLGSKGAFSDSSFSIFVDHWVDGGGNVLRSEPKLTGAVVEINGARELLSGDVWNLLSELRSFHQRPASERSQQSNEQSWSRMRKFALAGRAPMGDFLEKTIILTPDKLAIELRKAGEGEFKTVEVIPGFKEAPSRWLETFDRLGQVQDTYSISNGASMTRVIVTPAVKRVLQEIKRMPGRRVAGPRAEAFVRNPYGVLGPDATQVIDAEEFEAAREAAGLTFEQFTPLPLRDKENKLVGVALSIHSIRAGEPVFEERPFADADELADFASTLGRRIRDGSQCCFFQGYELEIQGDTAEHLGQLKTLLLEWRHGSVWTAVEILDLTNYSERIGAIGEEKPYALPFIVRREVADGWFPENVFLGYHFTATGSSAPTMVPVAIEQVPAIIAAVQAAKETDQADVRLPGALQPIPIADAERIASTFSDVARDLRNGELNATKLGRVIPQPEETKKIARQHLIIKSNIDVVDYSESRAALTLPQGAAPRLPKCLRSGVILKEHQRLGIAWLQHLFLQSPTSCRGALLADDMGLGKTLQLLSLIAERLESNTELDPVLVVAPVALLENWKDEIDKFFMPGVFRLLTLYGDELKAFRLRKSELDPELEVQGITRLLRKDWRGNANVVLTTYETMRDLEFSLAVQPWSIMVCDEAQKIKNPNALVTRAAKKQKVQFRIACTGTPVENTLMDLWCLFDFIQPGLLGALQQFGRDYRRPIEAQTEAQQACVEKLRSLIEPQVLRRNKSEVAEDLPKKIEDAACKKLPMSGTQHTLYHQAIEDLKRQRATNPSAQLQTLHLIRMVCSDPHWVLPEKSRGVATQQLLSESPKMAWTVGQLRKLAAQPTGEKVIIFCEFRELQLTIQRVVYEHFKLTAHIVNGETSADPRVHRNRQRLIKEFQATEGFSVIILSPQAVGFGVNIQAANHVIHFIRTWNPAKEDQATDRAYRIGQTRDVTVYTPSVTASGFKTFDEKLDELLTWKRTLAADMLNGSPELSVSDFAEIAN